MIMRPLTRPAPGWGLATVLLLAAAAEHARGQAPAGDAVDRLRAALQSQADPAERDRVTRECLAGLRGPGDLRRALTLTEWRDHSPEGSYVAVDQANRSAVAERFRQAFSRVFARREATSAVVALGMIADLANTARAAGEPASYLRPLGADLAELVAHAPPKVQAPAARTLGLIDADPALAVPALATLLRSGDPNLRCAAADGLFELLQTASRATAGDGPAGRTPAVRAAAVAAGCAVLPAAGQGLADWHAEVRRRCVGTLGAAAAALGRLVPDSPSAVPAEGADPAPRAGRSGTNCDRWRWRYGTRECR
jgi:hypothetical protein